MKNNKLAKIEDVAVEKDYQRLLEDVKSIREKGLYTAYKAVDNILVQTNWQIGERIVREELRHKDRAGYGKYLIENLAVDLNFTKRDLYRIIKFYRLYPIVGSVIPQLSWTHYYQLVNIDNAKKRSFYENKIIQNSWSVRELLRQIKANLYENTSPKEIQDTFQVKLPAVKTSEIFKDTYNFDFLQLQFGNKEKVVEDLIVNNIEKFLKEIGVDFGFFGRQVPLKIDQETHFIDLVLHNKAIPCTILVDLKLAKITSQDIGQMNKYVTCYRKTRQYPYEKDTIGLIIGREAGAEEICYALGDLEEKIFVAVYKAKLPSEEKLKEAVKQLS